MGKDGGAGGRKATTKGQEEKGDLCTHDLHVPSCVSTVRVLYIWYGVEGEALILLYISFEDCQS